MQKVSFGQTKSGQFGLFTNGFLAWPLKPEEYKRLTTIPHEQAKEEIAQRWRFKLSKN